MVVEMTETVEAGTTGIAESSGSSSQESSITTSDADGTG